MAKAKLGSGARFKALTNKLSGQPGIYNPAGLAASIGRKKYGKAKFQGLAAKGKKTYMPGMSEHMMVMPKKGMTMTCKECGATS